MPNLTIDIPGKPRPKTRPRVNKNGVVWTKSAKDQEAVAFHMLPHKGAFAGKRRLALTAWFYGDDVRADGDNLWKLIADAAVQAGVIDDDNRITYGSFERCHVDDDGNPFPGKPGTRVIVGDWP